MQTCMSRRFYHRVWLTPRSVSCRSAMVENGPAVALPSENRHRTVILPASPREIILGFVKVFQSPDWSLSIYGADYALDVVQGCISDEGGRPKVGCCLDCVRIAARRQGSPTALPSLERQDENRILHRGGGPRRDRRTSITRSVDKRFGRRRRRPP